MGPSLSELLAIVFMDTMERKALTEYQPIGLYKQYVDDCRKLDEQSANKFYIHMNQQHPRINFKWRKSSLDFNITITNHGQTEFEFYKKKAKKPLFVHYKTDLPKATKINFASSETNNL